jgi:hypothetical protein
MNHNKKTGSPAIAEATRNETDNLNPISLRVRVMAAIGRAALCGLLPLRLADRLIRRMRRSA